MTTETYTLNGQTDFDFNHPVRVESELTVEVVPGGVVSPGSYQVIGAGPAATGVTVRYPTAPSDGTKTLKVTRQAELQRLSDFTGAAGINATGLETEFNNLYRALRDAVFQETIKAPVKAATTSNIALSGEQTVNGVSVTDGDRVLVTSQTDDTENGIYNASTAAWTRTPDADGSEDLTNGTVVLDENLGEIWRFVFSGNFDPGTTPLTIVASSLASVAQSVDSVAALRNGSFPGVDRLWLSGYTGAGTQGGGSLYRKGSGYTSSDENGILWVDADGTGWEAGPGFVLAENATLRIPSDYGTIQGAVDQTSDIHVGSGVTIDILIEAGHALTDGAQFVKGDWGQYKISSEDATVFLDPNFYGVNPTSDTFADNSLFVAEQAYAPTLNCLVDMQSTNGCGYVLSNQSTGAVENNCGVINAGTSSSINDSGRAAFGLYLRQQSKASGALMNFKNASTGNRVTTNSMLQAPLSNFSGARNQNYNGGNTTAGMDVSRGSIVYITGSVGNETDITNSAGRGLAVRRSFVSATAVDCSGAALQGVKSSVGSQVAFNDSIANNCNTGISASGGGTIDATQASATGCTTRGLLANNGGRVLSDEGGFDNSGEEGVLAIKGGYVQCHDCTATGCDIGVNAQQGSWIDAGRADASGATSRGVNSSAGSHVNFSDGNAQKGASTDPTDILINNGAIINASGATGGTSETVNTLTGNGIIFQ